MALLNFKIGKYPNGVGLSRAFDSIDQPMKAWGMLQYRLTLQAFQQGGHAHHRGSGYILGHEATSPDYVDKWRRLNPDYEAWKIAHLRGEAKKKRAAMKKGPRAPRVASSPFARLFGAVRAGARMLRQLFSGPKPASPKKSRGPRPFRAPQKILVLTGRLKNSITSHVELMDATRAKIILGTNVEYGEKHQLGQGVPARPFIVVSTLDRENLENRLRAHFQKTINGATRGRN